MRLRDTLEKKEEKQRVRAALLRAALQLAAQHGFASLGLREVSREAGIAPTSFYRHFADMEELGSVLIRELGGELRRELTARLPATPPSEAIGALVEASFVAVGRDAELVRFMIAERTGAYPALRELLRAELSELARELAAAHSGEKLDPTRPPPFAAEAAVSVLLDACSRTLDEPADQPSLRHSLVACLRALLAVPVDPRGAHA